MDRNNEEIKKMLRFQTAEMGGYLIFYNEFGQGPDRKRIKCDQKEGEIIKFNLTF